MPKPGNEGMLGNERPPAAPLTEPTPLYKCIKLYYEKYDMEII